MNSPYRAHIQRWRALIDLVLGEATVKAIRQTAAAMKLVELPRSEWNNRASPFVLLKDHAKALPATPAGRARLKELAGECLVILGEAPLPVQPAPAPPPHTEQAWQRRADIGD